MKSRYYYVYYSYEEWGRGYIGKRACKCPPDEDKCYFGSFSDATFKPTEKIILAVFDNEKEAVEMEVQLHSFYQVDRNLHFANKARQTSSRFICSGNWKGKTHSPETKNKLSKINKGRKMTKESLEKIRKSKLNRRWWTNGKEQKSVAESPGAEWCKGKMLEGTTKGGGYWNNGVEQVFIKPPKTLPVGSEWSRGKLNKKPPRERRKKLFEEPFRSASLTEDFIERAKIVKKELGLARIGDGVVWVWKNAVEDERRRLLLSESGVKSVTLPKEIYCEINVTKTLLKLGND